MTFILKEHLLTVLSRVFGCNIKQHLLVEKCCFCPQTLARITAHKSMWKRFHTCSLCSPSFAHHLFRRQRFSKAVNWGSFMETIRRLSCKDDFKSIKLHDGRAAAGVGFIPPPGRFPISTCVCLFSKGSRSSRRFCFTRSPYSTRDTLDITWILKTAKSLKE